MGNRLVAPAKFSVAFVTAVFSVATLLACSRPGGGFTKAQARAAAAQTLPRHPVSSTPQIKQVVDSAIEQIGQTFDENRGRADVVEDNRSLQNVEINR